MSTRFRFLGPRSNEKEQGGSRGVPTDEYDDVIDDSVSEG